MKDFPKLMTSSILLYRDCGRDSVLGMIKAWPGIIAPFIYILALSLFQNLFSFVLHGFVGGLIFGLVNTLIAANYYCLVLHAINKEKVVLNELWGETIAIFPSVLNVLFALWIVTLLGGGLLNNAFAVAAVNLVLFVVLNPLPELTYLKGGGFIQAAEESYYLIRDNALEWFLPFSVFFGPLFFRSSFTEFTYIVSQINLIDFWRVYLGIILGVLRNSGDLFYGLGLPVALLLTHFMMVFRGNLFLRLSTSSRRKRIHQLNA
ncbi:MAG: hypothetical protein PHC51_04295 [bacterium]|nr:hypothetical protein [bacterium]